MSDSNIVLLGLAATGIPVGMAVGPAIEDNMSVFRRSYARAIAILGLGTAGVAAVSMAPLVGIPVLGISLGWAIKRAGYPVMLVAYALFTLGMVVLISRKMGASTSGIKEVMNQVRSLNKTTVSQDSDSADFYTNKV